MAPSRNHRLAFLAATVMATVAGTGLVPAPAAAAGRCAPGEGVTVVVDFGGLGGGTQVACVQDGAGQPSTVVVERAGFELDGVRSDPGFICAINRRPDPNSSCARTPPADAFWGLFWSNGSSARWSFSTVGAGSLDVPEGGSIGWRWQNGGARDEPGAPPTTGTSSPEPAPEPAPEPSRDPDPTPGPTKPPSPAPGSPSAPSGTPQGAAPEGSASPGATSDTGPAGSRAGAPDRASAESRERADKRAQQRAEERAEQRAERRAERRAEQRAERRAERDAADEEQVTAEGVQQQETPLAVTSGSTSDGGNGALTWAAGAAVLLLAAAAGVLARRRRS